MNCVSVSRETCSAKTFHSMTVVDCGSTGLIVAAALGPQAMRQQQALDDDVFAIDRQHRILLGVG